MKDRIEKAKTWIKDHRTALSVAGLGVAVVTGVALFKENFSKEKRYPYSHGAGYAELPPATLEELEHELAEIREMHEYVQADIDAIKSK
jgi:hypothetical protein